ncbi:MAG: class I SAM-dependent methyltransferase [Bacteroidota bacterium]
MTDSTIKLYNRTTQRYEDKWEKYLRHTHRALLEHIEVNSSDKILDVSSGTGLLAQQMLEQSYSFDEFCLNDPSDRMLAIARRRFSKHEKIRFTNEKVQHLSHPVNYFKTIISLNSFHF